MVTRPRESGTTCTRTYAKGIPHEDQKTRDRATRLAPGCSTTAGRTRFEVNWARAAVLAARFARSSTTGTKIGMGDTSPRTTGTGVRHADLPGKPGDGTGGLLALPDFRRAIPTRRFGWDPVAGLRRPVKRRGTTTAAELATSAGMRGLIRACARQHSRLRPLGTYGGAAAPNNSESCAHVAHVRGTDIRPLRAQTVATIGATPSSSILSRVRGH